jgi:hypothetical protein
MFPPAAQPPAPHPQDRPTGRTDRTETPGVPGTPGDERAAARVHLGPRRWLLPPGQRISFGRGSPCDIRIAHDPLDEHVSRRAGVMEHRGGDLVLRNESSTRRLVFRPARGPERVLRPGEAVTCLPHREFLVAVDGRGGSHYVLQVSVPTVG